MEEAKLISQPEKRWKTVVFTIFAAIFSLGGLFFLESLPEGLLPWATFGCPGCEPGDPNYPLDTSRWFGAQHGATVGILFTGSLLTLLWKPWNKLLLLQFYSLGFIIFALVYLFFRLGEIPLITLLIFIVPLILLAVFYPGKGLWHNMFKEADFHRMLLFLTIIALVALFPISWDHAVLQVKEGDIFSQYGRWAGSMNLSIALVFSSLLASTRKPGWKQLSIIIGIAYLYLGAAAITVPDQPGSWGITGGIVSLIGGIAYLACAFYKKKES